MGGVVGRFCGADGDFRQGRRRKREFRPCHLHSHVDDQTQNTNDDNRGYFRALKLGNAAQVAPIDKLSVVLVALFGVVFLDERLTAVNWFGVVLVAAGAILVAIG